MNNSKKLRCAVYTRKSTEEGLDQEFNSLDAQREACIAFIASQVGLGWKLVSDHYDDGGISGGTMERPALQRLLQDIRDRKIDVVVVYKIDRLTRSLMDFSRIVETFDGHDVSFVSVTQQFNTTTSMGRLTLNVLLSFAQFEREVTAERIRDKIAASKKKGMWMGGVVPLGYRVENRQLVIEPGEARTVRHLFERYLELRSVRALADEAAASGLTGKALVDGKPGKPLGRGNLYHLLSNPIYVGKIRHRDQLYPGAHQPTVDADLFERAQALLAKQAPARRSQRNIEGQHLLTGLVFDEAGVRLRSVHANKQGQHYRYYVSKHMIEERRRGRDGWRLPAAELDATVEYVLVQRLGNPAQLAQWITPWVEAGSIAAAIERAGQIAALWSTTSIDQKRATVQRLVSRFDLSAGSMTIRLDRSALASLVTGGAVRPDANVEETTAIITCPMSLRRRGVETRMILTDNSHPARSPDAALIDLIARAHRYLRQLVQSPGTTLTEVAKANGTDVSEISRLLPLAFLAPKIVEATMTGSQPVDLTAHRLSRLNGVPSSWAEQVQVLGM